MVVLQDDQVPPNSCGWLLQALLEFQAWPRLGAVGLNWAEYWHGRDTHPEGRHDRHAAHAIAYRDPLTGSLPFEFVSVVDFSPMAIRRAALVDVGGMDEGLAAPGECGIFTDFELSLRLWASGWQVGFMQAKDGFNAVRFLSGLPSGLFRHLVSLMSMSRAGQFSVPLLTELSVRPYVRFPSSAADTAQAGEGGTHGSVQKSAACWGRQAHLNSCAPRETPWRRGCSAARCGAARCSSVL